MLLSKGANVNDEGGWYGNALTAAVINGHFDVVQLLLENGADINARSGPCGSALNAASYSGHDKIKKLLLRNGAATDPMDSQYSLHYAIQVCNNQKILELLDQGVDVNCQDEYGSTALEKAFSFCSFGAVKILIERGARISMLSRWHSDELRRTLEEDRDKDWTDFISENFNGEQKFGPENCSSSESCSGIEELSGSALDQDLEVDGTEEQSAERRRHDRFVEQIGLAGRKTSRILRIRR